jgi:hypothetical protein
MLRLLVLALIFANGLFFAWSNGLLRAYGFGPVQQRETYRIDQQVRPEALRILTPTELKRAEVQALADAAPKECLQAGPFDDPQVAVLRKALESSVGQSGWHFDAVVLPARWIIYMGKFANAEGLAKKRGELLAMNLTPHGLNNPALEIGLSLGSFESQAAATLELNRLAARGIRTARVVQERAEGRANQLKLPAVSESMKARLQEVKPAMAGRSWGACAG